MTTAVSDIFKFQASQFPAYRAQVLVYNKSQRVMFETPMTALLDGLFDRYGEKFYALAQCDASTGQISIANVVKPKSW